MRIFTKNKIIKWPIIVVLLFLFFYPEYVKKIIYPRIYGKLYEGKLAVWSNDLFGEPTGKQLNPIVRVYDGETVTFLPKKTYEVTARIGVLERYEGLWEQFYHGHDKDRQLYNSFAPIDLSLVYGHEAYSKYFDNCFKHEYRLLWSCPQISSQYFNNYHMIPANNNIRRGLETLHKGDVVYIKGLLVNVKVRNWREMNTGISHNMTHKDQFAGGLYTGMCFITYLEKLIVDGYVYE